MVDRDFSQLENLISQFHNQFRDLIKQEFSNISQNLIELLQNTVDYHPVKNLTVTKPSSENQLHAVLYIAVLLMLYAITLAAVLIKYMLQEQKVAAEQKLYQRFLAHTKQLAVVQVHFITNDITV